jgi:antitoxin MazE
MLEVDMTKTKIAKWGNSYGVRIPKEQLEKAGFSPNDAVIVEQTKGQITIKLAEHEPTLEELVSQITPDNCHESLWGDEPMGKEIW